jgi:hypothetical protein
MGFDAEAARRREEALLAEAEDEEPRTWTFADLEEEDAETERLGRLEDAREAALERRREAKRLARLAALKREKR